MRGLKGRTIVRWRGYFGSLLSAYTRQDTLFSGFFPAEILCGPFGAAHLLAYFCFLRQGKEIQADGCLFLLAVAFYSVGHYTGCSLDPVITLLNAGPETLPDWDYMHKWLGTEGYEYQMRQGFYLLSAFTTALGTYLFATHFWEWNNPDKHNFNNDNDGLDRFFITK